MSVLLGHDGTPPIKMARRFSVVMGINFIIRRGKPITLEYTVE